MREFSANVALTPRLDIEDVHRFCLGDAAATNQMDLKYVFDTIDNPSAGVFTIPNVGVNLGLGDLTLENHTNILSTLF